MVDSRADVEYVLLLLQAGFEVLATLGMVVMMGGNVAYALVPGLHVVALLVFASFVARGRWAVGRRRDRALRLRAQWNAASATVRWAAALLLVTAVVHLALPLGHHDSGLLTAAFLGSAVAYVAMAARAVDGRRWRVLTAL